MTRKLTVENRKVLLVDDDQFLRGMYAAKFAAQGAAVETADNSEEALQRLRGGLDPVLIVFDLVMPGLDGYGFIEAVTKEKLAQGAVKIALSNQSSEEEVARALQAGADGHLTKANATPSEIVEKILEMAS
jgi:two-component system, chemotaxis family, chemotaxis protein CheY